MQKNNTYIKMEMMIINVLNKCWEKLEPMKKENKKTKQTNDKYKKQVKIGYVVT